ncbi:Sporulation and spore germination [Actinopolyspora xinjiangensis]|uniref:Sporulation and spore germination n=1 Tax=Actinopolyspora xinjiangensis TaxID=405564 RepID=A0A1H0N651_9ACTN|nr:LpqB family beta-propeller domain-containing protein [Actinopolyspora xinjiangensis]SDO88152.1 Sporulation and spore germination [Actinopolyspora xinjiangensis]
MRLRGRLVRAVAVLSVLSVPVTGCASIPEETEAKAIRQVEEGRETSTQPQPPSERSGAQDIVRSFLDATAQPANDYEAARLRLTERAAESWKVPEELVIVNSVNIFPKQGENADDDSVQILQLDMHQRGRIRPDHSFVSDEKDISLTVRVERRSDGQWRITDPPKMLLVHRKEFINNYRSVSVYFLDQQRDGVIPDVRWVRQHPDSTLPARVISLLLSGPSKSFDSAMNTAIPEGTTTGSNVSETKSGALLVDLRGLGELSSKKKRLIAAQVVLTLSDVRTARVKLQHEGAPLLPSSDSLRPSDVSEYEQQNEVPRDVEPLAVVDEKLRVFSEQAPSVPGPAGDGSYQITNAARSDDGSRLAAVERADEEGVDLRVGPYGGALRKLPIHGSFMTRPTWRGESEVWTVVDGKRVMRATRDENGSWSVTEVDSSAFPDGGSIDALRIARGGTRLAAVVNGRIVVAGIAGSGSEVLLHRPTTLTGGLGDTEIKGVDWLSGDSLVAITGSDDVPVVKVSIDGFFWPTYRSSNLRDPSRVTVGPGQRVIVSDKEYLWQVRDQSDYWEVLQNIPIKKNSIPFFPG